MRYAAVLFDLDGTLIDTAADFIASLNSQCARRGVSSPPAETVRNTVSNGARALVELAFKLREGDAGFESCRQELLSIYEQYAGTAAPIFPQAQTCLNLLQQYRLPWGIVTNKPRYYTALLLQRIGLNNVPVVVCPDDVSNTKPDPEPLLLAASRLNVNAADCVYLGDHERDINAGRAAGMHTIACGWGYFPPSLNLDNWGANAIVHTSEHLQTALNLYV